MLCEKPIQHTCCELGGVAALALASVAASPNPPFSIVAGGLPAAPTASALPPRHCCRRFAVVACQWGKPLILTVAHATWGKPRRLTVASATWMRYPPFRFRAATAAAAPSPLPLAALCLRLPQPGPCHTTPWGKPPCRRRLPSSLPDVRWQWLSATVTWHRLPTCERGFGRARSFAACPLPFSQQCSTQCAPSVSVHT